MPNPIASTSPSPDWCSADAASAEELSSQPPPEPPAAPGPSSSCSCVAAGPLSAGASALTAKHDQFDRVFGFPRIEKDTTISGVHLQGGLDIVNGNAHVGILNPDGTRGANAGAMLTAVGAEVTAEYHGFSITAGVSASIGFSISSGGDRDIDHDGKPERCIEATIGLWTLGECDEF